MIEDELLKIRFRHGSSEALARIYQKYADYLLSLAMALLNNVHQAEDVLQDVFVNFAKSGCKFRLHGSLKSYLATCVINRCRDKLRAKKRQSCKLNDYENAECVHAGPYENLLCNERSILVNKAIGQLPDEQKEVIVLRIKGGMRYSKIAEIQQTSANTVRGRYRYGIEKLRSILNGTTDYMD